MPRRARLCVSASYAAQAIGYAVVVTSLPALKERQHVDDTVVSLIVLGVCVMAAVGSVVANAVAVRFGSRAALVLGLAVQAAALPLIAVPTPLTAFAVVFALYGVGLGCVDASQAMQAITVQRAYGRPIIGGFFATYTAAAIAGALLVSLVAASATAAGVAIATAAVPALVVAAVGSRLFAADRPVEAALPAAERANLPRAGILAFGLVILAVFVVDSAVSTWSAVYLQDDLAALPALAPLGYAVYQACILATRLATDRLLVVMSRRRLVTIATIVSVAGCLVVATLPFTAVAIAGFALAGVAVGVLVPVTFGAAGELSPEHSDQVIARVNIFNYAGAILGAVVVGLLADRSGLGPAFLVPAVVLAAALFVVPRFRSAAQGEPRREAASAHR
ncbi:MFS transporter [Microbacterium ulmi]|uniref:MFS transporter n=1 Tax=Microbacterium ulmi TaxID=179095 RepID=A0A7Y2Q0Y1_9MICO|nr:MFS transporter [Microbacterium ulmi]NII70308.1 MFS family permease [Microbacterium ulmi]NNH03355.1 MFS transporter [Microbacterium ulmi]